MTLEHNTHHLVLGEMTDYLTGRPVADTHDERYRQKIAKLLVETCGFKASQIKKSVDHVVDVGAKKSRIKIDFLVFIRDKIAMLIKYSPGSIVTRRQTCIALSRSMAPYQVPIAVMTNGETAEIIDGATGKVLDTGLEHLPTLPWLTEAAEVAGFVPIPDKTAALAHKIVHACEVDDACPCDSDICQIEQD